MNKFLKQLNIIIMICVFVIFSGCENNDEKNILKVGTSAELYPLNFKENQELKGYEIDVLKEIGLRSGLKIEYKISKFSGLFGMLDSSKIDTIAHQIAITDDREKIYNFSIPYVYSDYKLIYKGNSKKNINDLKGSKVGAVIGALATQKLKEISEKENLQLEIKEYDTIASMDMDLNSQKISARLGSFLHTRGIIQKNKLNFSIMEQSITFEKSGFIFKKENKEKLKKVNQALSEMKKDGTLKKISIRWFKDDITKEKEI